MTKGISFWENIIQNMPEYKIISGAYSSLDTPLFSWGIEDYEDMINYCLTQAAKSPYPTTCAWWDYAVMYENIKRSMYRV